MILFSWGRLKTFKSKHHPTIDKKKGFLSIGNLRSYGDQAYSTNVQFTVQNNRVLMFDHKTGLLSCESGLFINDLCVIVHKYGFTIPVVPGSGFVTIGGAISNDIHGKSHHLSGSFGNHIENLLISYKGKILNCSPAKNKELFKSIIGGMGLVGEIRQVTLKLIKRTKTDYFVESIPYKSIDTFFRLSENSINYSDTVAWFDCTNKNYRGVFFRAKPIHNLKKTSKKSKISYRLNHNFSLINNLSIFFINKIYFYLHFFKRKKIITFDQFHHPLDRILHWNKIYGSKGFFQFQGIIPKKYAREGILELLDTIRVSKQGSFLSVLKNFGPKKSLGYLSFPIEGTTIAIDFSNQGEKTEKLIHNLYNIVISYGGRIYPAKDALMTSDQFRLCYPDIRKFLKFRDSSIQSEMSRRYKI